MSSNSEGADRRVFTPVDIPADPVDRLIEPEYFTEKDITEANYRMEDLREDRQQRAEYGVSVRDIWNFYGHWMSIFARGLRILAAQEPEGGRKVLFDNLTEGAIASVELGNMNDLAFYADAAKNDASYHQWEAKWKAEIEEFQRILNTHWISMFDGDVDEVWSKPVIDSVKAKLPMSYSFEEVRNLIPDPIIVPEEDKAVHYNQRSIHGFSDWDLKNFSIYLVWLIAQACLFFTSTDSHGYPQSEEHPTPDIYRSYLLDFMFKLLYGESVMHHFGSSVTPQNVLDDYKDAVSKFTGVLRGFWD